mgnify:FL=1
MDLEFRTQLIAFLRACGCPDERLFALLRGVFFRGLRVRLVGSVARVLHGKKMSEFGHLRLRAILQSLGEYYAAVHVDGGVWSGCVKCDAVKRAGKGGDAKRSGAVNSKPTNTKESNTEVPLPLLSLCSSIGSPYKNWLCSILRSCHGGRALPPTAELSRCLEVVFPTEQFVRDSRIGEEMAGSLIFKHKNFEAGRYSRAFLKQYRNVAGREGTLPHAKYRGRRRRV